MKDSILTHSSWTLITMITFFVGSQLAPSSKKSDQSLMGKGSDINAERAKNYQLLNAPRSSKMKSSGTALTQGSAEDFRPRGLAGRSRSNPSSAKSSDSSDFMNQKGPLNKKQLQDLVQLAVKSTNPIERRKAFDRLLEEMRSDTFTYEQAMTIRHAMHHGGADGEQWRTFDYAWGANDPASAVAEIDKIPEQYRRGFTSNMLPGLASVEPRTAIGIVESMEGEMRQQMTGRLLEGLADYDVGFATDYVFDMAESGDPNASQYMRKLAREVMETAGFEGGIEWAESLQEGALQAAALRSVANEYANNDPQAAAQWAEQFVGTEQNSRLFGEIVREWGNKEAASVWVESLEPSQGQRDALSAVYGHRGATSPEQALKEIQAMPQSADKDFALNGFISGLAHQDGEAAVAWAAEIDMPGMREAAMVRAAKQYYKQDRQATEEWFVASGLPSESWRQIVSSK